MWPQWRVVRRRLRIIPTKSRGHIRGSSESNCRCLDVPHERGKRVNNMVQHRLSETGINANPKHISHHIVRDLQFGGYAVLGTLICRLPHQITCKQQPRADLPAFQRLDERVTSKRRILADSQRKTKPAWVRLRSAFRENQDLFKNLQALMQIPEVFSARRDEPRKPLQLRQSQRGLHVSHLQVITDMRIYVFMIIP